VVAAFATFGLFWGSWAVMVYNIQHTFDINDAQLGLLLAVAIAVAGASSAVMAHLADRVGARRLLWIALFAWSGLLVLLSAAPEKWLFVVALILVEIAGGSIDTAMNAEVSHRLIGHPAALVRFHALFNCGALCGAALAGVLLHAGVSWRWVWPGVAAVALAVGVWALATEADVPPVRDGPDAEHARTNGEQQPASIHAGDGSGGPRCSPGAARRARPRARGRAHEGPPRLRQPHRGPVL